LKLTKTSWLILSVGIFIVIVAGLGFTRSQQMQEQEQLDENLSVAEVRLGKLQVKDLRQQQEELQMRLDESKIQLAAAKDKLRQTVESINVTDEFFAIAQYCGVKIMSLSSSNIKSEKLGDIVCSVISLNAVVSGEVPDLISYVIKLNNDFTTGVVKSAQISIREKVDEGEASASIQMVVYAYEGD
jgi:peptidoglycan hydrolase CwlO-like protein